MLLLQMCVQRKKPEVSIMYLRGDTPILVPAVFSEIVALLYLPRRLYLLNVISIPGAEFSTEARKDFKQQYAVK